MAAVLNGGLGKRKGNGMGQLKGLAGVTAAMRAANDVLEVRTKLKPLLLEQGIVGLVSFELVAQGLRYVVRRAGKEIGAARAFDHPLSRREAEARAREIYRKAVAAELASKNPQALRSTLQVTR